jgi:hypothetical protein
MIVFLGIIDSPRGLLHLSSQTLKGLNLKFYVSHMGADSVLLRYTELPSPGWVTQKSRVYLQGSVCNKT